MSKIYLSPPHLGLNEEKYVQDAISKNWVSTVGENITELESSIEKYLGNNKFVTALNSGTSALHLALILAGVKKDDDVICQTFTFAATANCITYIGANPIFVDSEISTWNMSPEYLEECIKDRIKIGKKPKAIIVVDLYGTPFLADEIIKISKKYEITLIEDAACALGSSYKNQKCGTLGDLSIISFNGNKIITTSSGGALICNNNVIKKKAVFYATQAKDLAPHYQHSEIGYNYRMSNICAGIGRGQMELIDDRVESRRKNHQFYTDLFKNIKEVEVFQAPENTFSNYWLSCILIKSNKKSYLDLKKSLEESNIESRPLWKPLHLQPVFKSAKYYGDSIAENLFNIGLCLPSGSNLSNNDRDKIKNVILNHF